MSGSTPAHSIQGHLLAAASCRNMSVVAEIVPFHGLRYDEAKAGPLADLICPPYDVIGDGLRNELYAKNEHNFVRIEHGKPQTGDDPVDDKYSRAKVTLDAWTEKGVLRYDTTPAFYLYDHYFELGGERLRRRGFLGALRLYQMGRGVVRPHEQTTPKDKTDRLRLLRLTRLNASPIFGLYEDPKAHVAGMLEEWMARGPARFVAEARVGDERHLLWALDDRALTAKLQGALKEARIYLADGHHRYEVALEYLKEENEAKRIDFAEDTPNYVMAYLCALDDPGLRILPTHRVVRGASAAIDEAVARSFEGSPIDKGGLADTQPGIVLVRDGVFTRLEPRADVDLSHLAEAWRSLPIAQAEALLIDPARSAGGTVAYEHDTDRAIAAAAGEASAVLVRGVGPMTLKTVADAWERLPAKTTYFYPKVPAGLVARPLGV
ncbi:MAG: DUF1015 domain-containing protein [Chloroflexi bacterium]|nr:DUF1015 domain-containing protein [Chloroflexota bacterium]